MKRFVFFIVFRKKKSWQFTLNKVVKPLLKSFRYKKTRLGQIVESIGKQNFSAFGVTLGLPLQ
jgi:hypothetical protein